MKLIFKGVVQGVGFRPTVYRIAQKLGLKGYVLNKGSEVEVVVDRDEQKFIDLLKKNLPEIAQITDIILRPDTRVFKDFRILHSRNGERESLIPTDVATCDKCLEEIFNPTDRRYLFPFTNCTICGARFSLINDVPYDRERTAMEKFSLCEQCNREYIDVFDRRYHAQTISCSTCGPSYHLFDHQQNDLGAKDAITRFAQEIDKGKIGILKSWGGMHICCKLEEIQRFRKWYHRPQKSFAVMVKDIATAEKYGDPTDQDKKLLLSNKRPIVLLPKKKAELVSPGLNTIGVFLPYTGLHHILFSSVHADALIMTSANIPGEPMLTSNEDVFSLGADIYLLHNRDIPNRVDDTVARTWKNNTFFLRKSRGYVPDPLPIPYKAKVVSVGADENITGALSVDGNVYSTQYIGNAKYYSTLEFLESSLRHLMQLLMKKPFLDAVAMDLHPGYDSRGVAKRFAEEFSVPVFEVQHDWAHAASLFVDTGVTESIVLTLEGLGYGTDGTFWGSEVLQADFNQFTRLGHLEYIPLLGGDQATRDPRRLVYAIFKQLGKTMFFKDAEAEVLSKLMEKSPQTCSLGRYLDTLSAYFGICIKRTYSGEPAMKLEKYLAQGNHRYRFDVDIKNNIVGVIDLFRQLDEHMKPELSETKKADLIYSLVKTIVESLTDIAQAAAEEQGIKTIGISGGVTYNIPIVEIIEHRVKESGLQLLVHNRVPNGDGGIAIGQNAIVGSKLS